MEKKFIEHSEKYSSLHEGEFELSPKNRVFPPDFLEDEEQFYKDPQSAYIKANSKKHTHLNVDVSEGNAPLEVHFSSGEKSVGKDLVWIGENKTMKIPYPEDSNECDIYFLRRLNKGFCKAKYKLTKE